MRKFPTAAALILASGCLYAAPDNTISLETVKAQNLAPISAEELQQMVHGGVTVSHRAPSTGNWRRASLKDDGTLTIANRSANNGGASGSNGSGTWKVEGNRLCMDIKWAASTEAWCRGIYKYNGGMYSVPVDLEKANASMYGLIEVN